MSRDHPNPNTDCGLYGIIHVCVACVCVKLELWQTGSPFLDDMCRDPPNPNTDYCLYGIIHVLTIHVLRYRDKELAKFVESMLAQEYSQFYV